ncbi:Ubiquinol cytochrome c reductase subunit RIP1 [Klebsormidium nitens]|uniref:Ubiquinol cytochrome c reductase subunit RIP1 n=1 Tax=Klebsormidium nitens TaxID=105231 RepID=A0A1Y1IRZ4_KLENI|nr:Ubiquinol cytochrome c reductase subunit RIP1 [Klebsormidium nitens]|eukprot:GAQ92792.1 Ubiquinol cytochrome c reductase subunit RIP1 [Klebsormidium nitens]
MSGAALGDVARGAGLATGTVGGGTVNMAPLSTRIVPGLVHDVWQQDKSLPKYPKLTSDEEDDVIIVGAGIAGLSIAYNLVQAGKKVIVLERYSIGAGQTGRTTAHIMKWNDDYYYTLESKFGTHAASLVADSHKKSIDWVKNVVEKENIDCDFQLVPGYLFGHDDDIRHKAGPSSSTRKTLEKEFDAAHRLGLTDTQKVHLGYDTKRGTIESASCSRTTATSTRSSIQNMTLVYRSSYGLGKLCSKLTSQHFPKLTSSPLLRPQYIHGLARCIAEKGGKIFEQTRVMGQTARDISTEDGHKVRARAGGGGVVLLTNSPIDHNLAVHARQLADRSYVVGLKIPKGSLERCSTAGQARWARARADVARFGVLVYEPADNLGLYGVEPFSEVLDGGHLYIATGDSGQGMTGGTIAGIVIADPILGKHNPWADVYSPKRMIHGLSSLAPLAEEFAKNIKGYGELLLPSKLQSADALANDDGDIFQKGIHHVAAYKDAEGKLHEYSAICPHIKALLQWNPLDKTFDCPCHGSIFDRYGRVINGPAKADLFPAPV